MTANDQQPVLVQITGKDILDKFDSLATSLQDLKATLTNVPETQRDHEQRIRKLEARIWFASGGASIGGAVLGYLVDYLIYKH